ncbi:MAG: TolC family protein [Carboxylicivirga sp.]|nr:TolC family protein [Carboxylicivirga sp.]
MTLTLNDVLLLSQVQSLQSFLIKNYYLSDYWQYRSFKADYLPSVNLNSSLFKYNNSSRLRYNSITQTDEFQRTENMSSNAIVNINQKIGLTGGAVSVISDLGRIQNYGEKGFVQYSSIPIKIGYRQDLFGFNSLKWERKTAPLKYEKAKKKYIESVEAMNVTAVNHFFQVAISEMRLKMADYNYHQTDTLLQVAEKRFKLGSITKSELLDLRLSMNNTSIRLQETKLNHRKARENLLTFLMLPLRTSIEIILPEGIPKLEIDTEKALYEVLSNNPEILRQELSKINAQMKVAQTKAANRFKADISLNVGISKNDGRYDYIDNRPINGEVANVYQPEFDDYQIVNIGLSIPILDWGKGKGNYEMAKSQQQIAKIASQQVLQQFEQNTITQVLEFNIQKSKVESAAFSNELASESYDLTVIRFRKGKVDVLKLVNSQNAKDNAEVNYISALAEYWRSYYGIRQLTLFDFENNVSLCVDFNKIVQ